MLPIKYTSSSQSRLQGLWNNDVGASRLVWQLHCSPRVYQTHLSPRLFFVGFVHTKLFLHSASIHDGLLKECILATKGWLLSNIAFHRFFLFKILFGGSFMKAAKVWVLNCILSLGYCCDLLVAMGLRVNCSS